MYEVELRALVNDFYGMKSFLDTIADPIIENEKEVTIFFSNPNKEDFDLRLRLKKNEYSLNYKDHISKKAREEIESHITDPEMIQKILLRSGFKIKMIVARIKYVYIHGNFEILLNRVIDWGDAIEIECLVENESDAHRAEEDIRNFINEKLKIPELDKKTMLQMNEEYKKLIDFESIKIEDLLEYVNSENENIKFI